MVALRTRLSFVPASGAILALFLQSTSLRADWSFTVEAAAGGSSSCPVLEPFSYNASSCQFVGQISTRASNRSELWSDALVQSALSFGNGCNRPYQHYLWLDGAIYRIPDTAFVQHQRALLGIAALNLQNCQRAGGGPVVSGVSPRLLLSNVDITYSGDARWFFDEPAKRAYLRISSFSGDVSCSGAHPTPILGDTIFIDGIELF